MTGRVLLLEDNIAVAQSTMAAMQYLGIEVMHASCVADARALYEVDLFDVIVCDHDLPDGTGLDFLAGIAGVDKAKTVVWSGEDPTAKVETSQLHVDLVLTKGVRSAREILAAIESWL